MNEDEIIELARRVKSAKSDNIYILCELANLDPETDFQNADLRGINLRGMDVRLFDFRGSILYDANLKGTIFRKENYYNCDFYDFEGGVQARSRVAGRKFLTSSRAEWRLAYFLALLCVDGGQYAHNYTRGREDRSLFLDQVVTRLNRGEDISSIRFDVAYYLESHTKSGYPMGKYKYRRVFHEVLDEFPEAVSFMPRI